MHAAKEAGLLLLARSILLPSPAGAAPLCFSVMRRKVRQSIIHSYALAAKKKAALLLANSMLKQPRLLGQRHCVRKQKQKSENCSTEVEWAGYHALLC